MSDIFAGIDLGTDSIKIVVSEKVNDKFFVLASASSASKGIRNGFIEDAKMAISSIKAALKQIEEKLGFKLNKIIACIPSSNCHMAILLGKVNVIDYNEITGTDISNVLRDALKEYDFKDVELVTAMPISFTVDDTSNIKDPKGMKGSVLETRVVVSTVPKGPLYQILDVLKQAGVEVVDIAFTSIGDYYAIKNKKYDDLVGAIINIGEESTNVSIFNKGILIKNNLLPVGSKNVDKDLSYVFKSKMQESRNIKENFAVALSSYAESGDFYSFSVDKDTIKDVNQVNVSKVVEARAREILKLSKNEIKNLTNREIRYIIITGGLTELVGFSSLVEQEFGFIAKVCNITTLGVRHNKYSSSYGITKYFDDKLNLRGKQYEMVSQSDVETMMSMDSSIAKETILSKVFEKFFEH